MSSNTTGENRWAEDETDTTRAPSASARAFRRPDGQGEVAEEVGRELRLPPAIVHDAFLDGHDAGVVDQQVKGLVPALDEPAHRVEVGELQLPDVDVAGSRSPP